MEKADHLFRLIAAKILQQDLRAEESHELDSWLEASPENRALFERIKRLESTRHILELEQENYGETMVMACMERLRKPANTRRRLYLWMGGAAATVLLLIAGVLFLKTGQDWFTKKEYIAQNDIIPGKIKAILTLADGEKVNISQPTDSSLLHEKQFVDFEKLVSQSPRSHPGNPDDWHTLSVPAGGEFFYILGDSTKVWLNSQTELRFPARFSGHERRVFLKGEAYFEVTENKKQPFIVSLSKGDITVYGTQFTVTDYEESPLSAVLVEGSIGFVTTSGQAVRLKPSERVVYNTETDALSVDKVNTGLYTAWVSNLFIFSGQPLEEIMKTLSRWYDIQPIFETEEIKTIRLSGRLYRYENIQILLKTFEKTAGIRFHIEGKNITMTKK